MPMPFTKIAAILCGALLLSACAGQSARNPVPEQIVDEARIAGYSHIRFWGDVLPERSDAAATLRAAHRAADYRRGPAPRKLDFLAVSGGGEDGAYGAGLLNGWQARGTRPEFEIVTGVSTGALIGTFAFLGPSRDAQMRQFYTEYSSKQILRSRGIIGVVLGGISLADDAPLAKLIDRAVDEQMLDEIAEQHRRGRRFFVASTNLDAQRPVIWDMGAIAASNHPTRLSLFRSVLLASASIPGMFPPVRIQVTVDGRVYDELHVDGGVTENAFVFPALFMEASTTLGRHVPRTLYIISNGKLAPEWQKTDYRLLPIVARSIATLAKVHGLGDLFRLYALTRARGIGYRLTSIPEDFHVASKEAFDMHYMDQLYRIGYEAGARGNPWLTEPPSMGFLKTELR